MSELLTGPGLAAIAGALVLGLIGGYFFRLLIARMLQREAEKRRDEILESAQEEAERQKREAELEAQQKIIERREKFENEVQETRNELRQTERRLDKREDSLDKKEELLGKKERYLETSEKNVAEKRRELSEKEEELEQVIENQKDELYRISGLSEEEAREMILERIREDVEEDSQEMVNQRLARAREEAEQKAKDILVSSIERCSAASTSETTVCTIELPSDDLKGRIIGREGRNIRAFEKATGIDVIVDDTPGVVVLSGFDSVRREVARLSMERLIADGRIHPGRIEDIVDEASQEVDKMIAETGKETCFNLGQGSIPKPLQSLIGRLKFRTSFGQNTLQHSVEVAELAGLMAGELNMDVDTARRCGLLHDIGKALDQDHEGSHAQLGAEEARKRGEKPEIVNAIAAHHEDVDASSLYAGLIIAADTISASRPGARRETLERYVKRLQRLENLATQHRGVNRAFAIQAGREIRIIVDPNKVNDKTAAKLSRDVAGEIEDELQYPGEIMVTVIRETRHVEKAH